MHSAVAHDLPRNVCMVRHSANYLLPMMRDRYILIADDDIDDREIVTDALKECDSMLPLKFFGNGLEIVNHLLNLQFHY